MEKEIKIDWMTSTERRTPYDKRFLWPFSTLCSQGYNVEAVLSRLCGDLHVAYIYEIVHKLQQHLIYFLRYPDDVIM